MLGLASLRGTSRYELSVCLLLASLLTSTYLIFQNGFLEAADLITFSAVIFDLQWKDIKLTSCNDLLLKYRQSFQTSDILELSETPGHTWMWRRVWLISELYLLFPSIEDIVWSCFDLSAVKWEYLSTVSKLSSESTALDLALLSSLFISLLYFVLHSVIRMVQAADVWYSRVNISCIWQVCYVNKRSDLKLSLQFTQINQVKLSCFRAAGSVRCRQAANHKCSESQKAVDRLQHCHMSKNNKWHVDF